LAQDDYYYEIQLTNKQLVFYFLAGATGLILSFLAGVMVGRGVDQAGEVQAAQPVREDRIVAEETPRPASSPLAQDLNYARRLEGEKGTDPLEAGKSPKAPSRAAATAPPAPVAKPVAKPSPTPPAPVQAQAKPAPTPARAAPTPKPARAEPTPKPAEAKAAPRAAPGGAFTIQVGAFKDEDTAQSVVARLKAKGFPAYVGSPEGSESGLYNVRVGHYAARAEAERVQVKLRDDEKFKPFIVKP
jgi:cell division septation protein DedD